MRRGRKSLPLQEINHPAWSMIAIVTKLNNNNNLKITGTMPKQYAEHKKSKYKKQPYWAPTYFGKY
jgi:hypothetical protein